MSEINDALGVNILDRNKLQNITNAVEEISKNPPSMTCVNIFLNDNSALQHAVIKKIIMESANISDSEADWYLLMQGVYLELQKLSVIGIKKENESKD